MVDQSKLYSVHFLRFFAAVAVTLHHITTGLGSTVYVGAAGVDIFFVISGVVIGLSLSTAESAANFSAKRFIRVMPLYWIATLAFVLFEYSAWSIVPTGSDLIRSLLLWPKFGTDWHEIYFPAWTLTYEMLFYVVASASLLIFQRHALAVTLIIFVCVGAFRIPVPGSDSIFSTGICLEFCAGLVVACLIRSKTITPLPVAVFMMIVAGVLFWRNQTAVLIITEHIDGFHLARPLELGIPSALLVYGLLSFDSAQWLRNPFIKLGGNASYALYVSHITVIDFVGDRAARHGIHIADYPVASTVALALATIAGGFAFHLAVERPLLRALRKFTIERKGHHLTPKSVR